MDALASRDFADRLMREVWIPFDDTAVPRFYHRDVVGHHRTQELAFEDIVHRLQWDQKHFSDAIYDIRDIIADADRFAIRFLYTARVLPAGEQLRTEVTYFYHLRSSLIAEFWLLSDKDFDYQAKG